MESLRPTTKACVSHAAQLTRPELHTANILRVAVVVTASSFALAIVVAPLEARFPVCAGSDQTLQLVLPALLLALLSRADDDRQRSIRVRRTIVIGDRQGHEVVAGLIEPPRVSRRLNSLRGLGHEYKKAIFPGVSGESGTAG